MLAIVARLVTPGHSRAAHRREHTEPVCNLSNPVRVRPFFDFSFRTVGWLRRANALYCPSVPSHRDSWIGTLDTLVRLECHSVDNVFP